MDTGSTINRLDLLPATVSSPTAASPATAKTTTATTASASAATAAASGAATQAAAKEDAAAKAPSKNELKNSVDAINRFLKNNSELHFTIDEDSGRSVVKVIDTETRKILRQFPSEQSLEIGKNLGKKGMLIDHIA